jgi:uncharacterized cupredoxin-like copper-binding protein
MRRIASLIVLAVVVATLSSCSEKQKATTTGQDQSTNAPQSSTGGNQVAVADAKQVAVTVGDFKIAVVEPRLPAGKATFKVVGAGPSTHELVLFRSDLAPVKLPTVPDGTKVNEDGEGVQHIDEVEDVKAGTVKQLTVDLEPGRYVLVCNLPGHYKLGMRTGLVVA